MPCPCQASTTVIAISAVVASAGVRAKRATPIPCSVPSMARVQAPSAYWFQPSIAVSRCNSSSDSSRRGAKSVDEWTPETGGSLRLRSAVSTPA